MSFDLVAGTGLWFATGLISGGAYFWLLRRSVASMISASAGKAPAAGYFVVRFVLVAALMWAAAQQGPVPLVVLLGGFLVARAVALRLSREAADGR